MGVSGQRGRGTEDESEVSKLGNAVDCDDIIWNEEHSRSNTFSEIQYEKAQCEAFKLSECKHLGYFSFVSHLALWSVTFLLQVKKSR